MTVVNPHSLLEDKIKRISPPESLSELFFQWRKLITDKLDDEYSDFDCFVAGYFLGTNSALRDRYKKLYKIEKYDNRLTSPLHIKNNE